jgi:hypothetical protein
MDDKFLHELRRDPDPEFESRLRARLQAQGAPQATAAARWRPLAAAAAALIVVASSFALPSVRASAQSFLDIFRVRTFTPVAVDPERFKVLESESLNLERLMSKNIEMVKDSGPPRFAGGTDEAARLAGYNVQMPDYLPHGMVADSIFVTGESLARLTADASILAEVLRLLDIRDVRIPENLDGAQVQVHMPSAVQIRFVKDGRKVRFMQSTSPDVRLPPAMDLEDLGEIALRITGLSAGEARRLARSIDWHTTLLVPVPTSAKSFRNVTVNGNQGLMIEAGSGANALMWAHGEKVYALAGNVHGVELVEMANSVR